MRFWGRFRGFRTIRTGHDHHEVTRPHRRGELALTRARDILRQRGWVIPEQDEQLLRETLAELHELSFRPAFVPDAAYVAWQLGGDFTAFRSSPHRVLLGLRALEEEPLFQRVLLPHPAGVENEDSYVDLLWEAAAAAGTSEFLSGVNWGMDFRRTRRGFLNYTFAQRRHSTSITIDQDHWDQTALRQITTSVTPSSHDLIFDGTALFCWAPVRQAGRMLTALSGNPRDTF